MITWKLVITQYMVKIYDKEQEKRNKLLVYFVLTVTLKDLEIGRVIESTSSKKLSTCI